MKVLSDALMMLIFAQVGYAMSLRYCGWLVKLCIFPRGWCVAGNMSSCVFFRVVGVWW